METYIRMFYPRIYCNILYFTNRYINISWEERSYMFRNNVKTRPKCRIEKCSNDTYYKSTSKCYTSCCKKHSNFFYSSLAEKELASFIKTIYNGEIKENFKCFLNKT
jgi:hypothetical protein